MKYTLVVVDMQSRFNAANGERVRKNCLREIMKAIKNELPIIFLEWEGEEVTLPELTEPCKDNFYVETKRTDDGSTEVEKIVRRHKLPKTFRVCGVNTDCCVRATVVGLTARFPSATIDVIADACDSDWNHTGGLTCMSNMKNNVNVKFKEKTNV
jgi:nicotinamidase-related amidase